jgi:hypothetical protein
MQPSDFQSPAAPVMLRLAQPMTTDGSAPSLGAMTKYKTFNGEEINGEKVWHYDHHDDD